MKTRPEDAQRKILQTRLEKVNITVKHRTVRKTDGGARLEKPFKTVVMTVTFTLECGGKSVTRKVTSHRDDYLIRNGVGTPIKGARVNWGRAGWSIPFSDVYEAVKYLVYGTASLSLGQNSNSERHLSHMGRKLQSEISSKARRAVRTNKVGEVLSTADKKARRKDMIEQLRTKIGDFVKAYPEVREKEVVEALRAARAEQVVRDVMES